MKYSTRKYSYSYAKLIIHLFMLKNPTMFIFLHTEINTNRSGSLTHYLNEKN